MDYSAEAFRVDDLDEVVSLHRHLMPRRRGANRRYLRWKYFENPFIEDPLITVVRYGREIVAMEGLVGMAWRTNPKREAEVMPQVDDLIVHPDHRRRGLTSVLFQGVRDTSIHRGHRAMINMSGGDVSQAIALARGWVEVRELKRVHLIRGDGVAQEGSRLRFLGRVAPKTRSIARRFGHWMPAPPSDRIVDTVMEAVAGKSLHVSVSPEADSEAMSALAATVGRHASDRSAEYLRWRVANPDRTYRFVYWRDTRLRGYMIVGWTGEYRRRAMIIDHCCEHESVFAELLDAVTRIPRVDIELMASTLPQRESEVVQRLGFRSDPECIFGKRRFLLWPHASNTDDLSIPAAASSWRVDLIDTLQG